MAAQPEAILRKGAADKPTQLPFPWDDDSSSEESFGTEVKRFFHREEPKKKKTGWEWAVTILPCLAWLRVYNVKQDLASDLLAGMSVAAMVVPQGMSYANLAGLPSVIGLYGAFIPCIVYSFLGSSKQLAVGPVAVTSLLIGEGLKHILPEAGQISNPSAPLPELMEVQERYNHLAIQLSFLVGIMYTLVGLLRLGWLINFLSHAVISGFTSGATIIIGLSQVKYFLGVSVPRKDPVHEQLKTLHEVIDQFRWREFAMGVSALLVLIILKRVSNAHKKLVYIRAFGPLAVCLFGIILVYAGNIDKWGEVKVVQVIPAGLPRPVVNWWFPMPDFKDLLKLGIIVMLVDLLESTSIARALARQNHYELVYNQEIIGLGIANIAGSIFHSYTTTGSFSRSAVNNTVGAKTPLAQFTCGLIVMFVLLVLTPFFEHMPYNCLAAVIISGLMTLFDGATAVHLWRISKKDFLVWVAAFIGTMFAGVEKGIAIALGLAIVVVIYESAFPHTAILGRIPGTTVYRNIKQYTEAEVFDGLLLFRIDAPLYFANINHVRDHLRRKITAARNAGSKLDYVILELSPVTHIDSTALTAIDEVIRELREQNIQLVLANPNAYVTKKLELDHIPELLGREWIFVRVHDAVQYALSRRHEKTVDRLEAAPKF